MWVEEGRALVLKLKERELSGLPMLSATKWEVHLGMGHGAEVSPGGGVVYVWHCVCVALNRPRLPPPPATRTPSWFFFASQGRLWLYAQRKDLSFPPSACLPPTRPHGPVSPPGPVLFRGFSFVAPGLCGLPTGSIQGAQCSVGVCPQQARRDRGRGPPQRLCG